jgi:hypothetical protein
LPADLRVGTYELRVGLYGLADSARLPVSGPAGRVKDSSAVLAQVDVR